MKAEWKRYQVADLIAEKKLFIGDGYRAKNDELDSSGIPFARAGNINDGFRFDDADHFPEANLARVGNKISEAGDVVFTSKGTVGRFAFVREGTQRFVYSPQLCFWRSIDTDTIHPRFLFYWMFGREFFLQFKGVAGQTDMAEYVSLGDQRQMRVTLPNPEEQRAIASVLGALDDKIELNRRMNETLEALAQSLFKSWFVDATQSALPKGWRETTLGEVVELRTDRVDAAPAKDNERYIALEDMPSKSIDLSSYQAGSAVNSSIIRFRKGDILFGSMRPYFHKVGLASFDGITRTTTFVLRPKQNHLRHFALFHFFSNEVIDFSTTSSVGTTIPYIKWDALERYQIALPPDALLEEFEQAVAPLVQHIANNGEESRTLAALRDALLPKLLSGELRVPAAAQLVEATA